MRELSFSPDAAVEVNIDADNSRDVWFPATFIKQVGNNSFLVEYQSSSEAGLQKVAVDSLHIRPSPPSASNKTFNLLEKVDAFYDCRWLSGVVTKILADRRYIVYFKHTKKEKELCLTDLRVHMEWTKGKWVHSSQDTSNSSNSEKRAGHANGAFKEKICAPSQDSSTLKENNGVDMISAVTLKSCQKELHASDSDKANNNSTTASNKRIKQASANGDAISSRHSRRLNEEGASDAMLSQETRKSKAKQAEGSNDGTTVNVDTLTPGHPGKSSLKQSEDSNQLPDSMENKGGYEKSPVTRRRGRPRKLQALVPETVDPIPNSSDIVAPLVPIVIGLTHNGKMIDSRAESSGQHLKVDQEKSVEADEKHLGTLADRESLGSEPQKEGQVTILKRKRGRPPKVLFRLGSPKNEEAEILGKESKDAVNAEGSTERHSPADEVVKPFVVLEPAAISDSTPSTDSCTRQVMIISDQVKHLSDIRRLSATSTARRQTGKQRKIPKLTAVAESNEPAKTFTLRGRKLKSTKPLELPTEDAVENSRERAVQVLNNGLSRDVARAVAVTSSNASDDDKPLSAWFEGAHSLPAPDGRAAVAETAGQCDETGERRDRNETAPGGQPKEKGQEKRHEYTLVGNASQGNDVPERRDETPSQSTAIVPRENHDLPFIKNSLIWEMIESMEVLKRIPQKPHFRPLYNCKEECREGLAIGSMVTFTSLVERISRSRFEDPKSLLEGYVEALVDLEDLGFNVAPVREQLDRLLSIKGKYEQAQNTSKEIESQILERDHEKSKINEEIAELEKKISELKEKQALALSKKERKDAEIILLQSSVDAVKGALESAEEEFEKVTASLW